MGRIVGTARVAATLGVVLVALAAGPLAGLGAYVCLGAILGAESEWSRQAVLDYAVIAFGVAAAGGVILAVYVLRNLWR